MREGSVWQEAANLQGLELQSQVNGHQDLEDRKSDLRALAQDDYPAECLVRSGWDLVVEPSHGGAIVEAEGQSIDTEPPKHLAADRILTIFGDAEAPCPKGHVLGDPDERNVAGNPGLGAGQRRRQRGRRLASGSCSRAGHLGCPCRRTEVVVDEPAEVAQQLVTQLGL